jgi:hypothetical protein
VHKYVERRKEKNKQKKSKSLSFISMSMADPQIGESQFHHLPSRDLCVLN